MTETNHDMTCINAQDLVKKLLSREVQTRLGNLRGGTDDIVQHKWFRGFDFDGMMQRKSRAPWVLKIKNATDTSNFDAYEEEQDNLDELPNIDHGQWEREFSLERWTYSFFSGNGNGNGEAAAATAASSSPSTFSPMPQASSVSSGSRS